MLYSIVVGIITYYAIFLGIGILVSSKAIEGTLIAFAVFCFIGAYFARKSNFVRRMANIIGGIITSLVIAEIIILPILKGSGNTWIIIISIFAAITCYTITRRYWHRRYLRRDRQTGCRPAPPFGKEWARLVIAFVA